MTQHQPYAAADGLVRVYPAGAPGGAGLVWAHGGGFVAGDLDMPEADWVARSFAARGIPVVSIDYRLVAGGRDVYPAASDDVLAAWSWAVSAAPGLGIDPDRLVVGGASAGANLVTGAVLRLLAGEVPGLPTPAAVFLAYPTLLAVQPDPDPALRAALDANPEADRFAPGRVREMYETYLGGPVEHPPLPAVPGLARPADLAGFPPALMVNDDVDELRVSGEAFGATLAAAGVAVEVVTEPGTEHGHLNRPDEPAASATVDRVVAWLARVAAPQPTT
ncbi:alpha/beta hydrolase fold domain-containing protein [Agromyces sp. G08B096]|uniref:Alpha/beta hydrolase fold domain-containing protein n=1 Tax=Agromyces sp. G08B096 TaxID=3156399 RepID=A0AAU7W6H7_9MICO